MRAAGIMTSVHGQVLIRTAAVNASEQKEENLQSKGNICKLFNFVFLFDFYSFPPHSESKMRFYFLLRPS